MLGSLPPAVLLGGDPIAVSAARSLHAIGVRVEALGVAGDPIRHSRACDVFVDMGPQAQLRDRLLEWLETGPRGAVVLPCDDHGLEFVARERPRLRELGYRPVEADDDVVLAMLDKPRSYELARAAGVPVPDSAVVTSVDEALALAARVGYPCGLKPRSSHRALLHGIREKVIVAGDRGALESAVTRCVAAGADMLLTEIVPGPEAMFCSYYSYLDEHGEPLYHLTKRKLRGFPPGFGLATYHETCWQPEVAELGLRFFQGVGLRGVGTVEFKYDARDGRWKLIECNHRFTGGNEVVRRAGIDVPRIAYDRAAGRPVRPITAFTVGKRQWHPIEDVRALPTYRRSGELTVAEWARSLWHRWSFPMWRADDPGPTLSSLAGKVPRLWLRLRRARR